MTESKSKLIEKVSKEKPPDIFTEIVHTSDESKDGSFVTHATWGIALNGKRYLLRDEVVYKDSL